MTYRRAIRFYLVVVFGLALTSSPARAQTPSEPEAPVPPPVPRAHAPKPPIGERYHLELAAGLWSTSPSAVRYSDTENSVLGTDIDFRGQLGLSDQRFPEFHATLRLTSRQKLRAEFIPLNYQQTTALTSNVVFAGASYLAGESVSSTLLWNAWRGMYEYDLVTGPRGFIGASLSVNDVVADGMLASPSTSVSAHVQIPMPGLGAIVRYYPLGRVSITGEFTGDVLPNRSADTHGHAFDFTGTAAVNVLRFLAIQAGYRSFDVTYAFAASVNTGHFVVRGPFAGGVIRF